MNRTTWMILGGIVLLAIVIWYFFMRKPKADTSEAAAAFEKEVQKNIAYIKKDPKWSALIKQKAKEKGITEEQMLRDDARWAAKQAGFTDPNE